MTRENRCGEICPESKGISEGRTKGIFLGLMLYFTVNLESSHNTDNINFFKKKLLVFASPGGQYWNSWLFVLLSLLPLENVFRKTLELNTVDVEIPSFIGEKAKQHMSNFNMKIKTSVKNATRSAIHEKLKNQVLTLLVQGPLLSLAIQEKEDLLWEKKVCSNWNLAPWNSC